MTALWWLKENNPHYYHVAINHYWLNKFNSGPLYGHLYKKQHEEEIMAVMDAVNSVQNESDDAVGSKSNYDTSIEDAEYAAIKEDQLEFNRRAKITGKPIASCVQMEDLKQTVFSIAPWGDAIPKFIFLDEDFKVLTFPNLFPREEGGFDVLQQRQRKLGP